MKNLCVVILCAFACSVSAQIVREVSTSGMMKAVYTVSLAECPQRVIRNTDDFGWRDSYYAIVAVPELSITNTPLLEVRFPTWNSDDIAGWLTGDSADVKYILDEQVVYIKWKTASSSNGENINKTKALIIVVYESNNKSELTVLNTGTGKSLALEWSTNAPNAKVEGYKVYRQSVVN